MTTANLVLPELIAAQAQPHVPINTALRRLDAAVQLTVIGTLNAPPGGSPSQGDRYIVGPAPTGAWAGNPHAIAFYSGTAWQFVAPQEGWLAYHQSTSEMKIYSSAASPDGWYPYRVQAAEVDVEGYFPGVPGNLEVMLQRSVVRAMTFPANFVGSRGHINTLPTATTVLSVRVNGSVIGTISISTAGVFTFATSGGTAQAATIGQKVDMVNQTPADATAAGISVTLVADL